MEIAEFSGAVLEPGDEDFETARQIWNGDIQRRPAAIARCTGTADVLAAVRFARERDLPIAVRSGGHSGPGFGTVDDGLVIDLSRMHDVRVDPAAGTARVSGGATLADLDHATHAFGLATPTGIVSTVGVAGLTLGGGHGHLTRRFGLTIDNLLEADVVLPNGEFVTTSAKSEPDLFWALRGGGGNFGVVTSLVLGLHPVSTVVAGPTLYEFERAAGVLRWYREFMAGAPDELSGFFAFLTVPPAPPFPPSLHFRKLCGIVWCYAGPPDQADRVFEPVRAFGPPLLFGVQPMPYPVLQSTFDALYPPGLQWYWRADLLDDITDEAVDVHVRHAAELPTLHSTVHFYPIDGAAHRVGADETAFTHRDARWSMMIAGVDPFPAHADRLRDWVNDYWKAVHPHSAGAAYVNFLMDEGTDRIRATYGANYERLARIKARFDPDNVFRLNQNIEPTSG